MAWLPSLEFVRRPGPAEDKAGVYRRQVSLGEWEVGESWVGMRATSGWPWDFQKLEGLGAAAPSLLVAGLSLGLQLPAWSGDSLVPGWTLGPADMGCWKVCFLTCPQGQQGKVAELSSHESRMQGCRLALPRLALSGCLRNMSVH